MTEVRARDNRWWNRVLGKRYCNTGGGVSEEFPKGRNSGRRQRGERRLGWWIGRGSNSERAGLGKTQKENQWSDSTEEHLRVVGKGEEGMQAHQSEQHPGELVKNLFGEIE